MRQSTHKPDLKSLVSALLVIALITPILTAQTPIEPNKTPVKALEEINELLRSFGGPSISKLDRVKISEQIRGARESMLNRQHPQIPHVRGVGPLREGVAPRQSPSSIETTIPDARAQNAPARTIVVTSTADDGPGSLRQALGIASNRDTINITVTGTIVLTSGELLITKSVTIRGPGAVSLSVSGGGASRIFHITPNLVVTISGLTITNGNASNLGNFPANSGGGISNDHSNLIVSDCVLSNNNALAGGGIFSNSKDGGNASVTIINSSFSGNSALYGGGVFSGGGFASTGPSGTATLTVNDSSLSNNSAIVAGGGIFSDGFAGTATLTGTKRALVK